MARRRQWHSVCRHKNTGKIWLKMSPSSQLSTMTPVPSNEIVPVIIKNCWPLVNLPTHDCVTQTGLEVFSLSHWQLQQHTPTIVAPCVVLMQGCFWSAASSSVANNANEVPIPHYKHHNLQKVSQAFVDVHFPPTMQGSGGKVGAGHDQKKLA